MTEPALGPGHSSIELRPLTPHIGAEIHGIDLRNLDDATFDEIQRVWADWMVLVFRDQQLTAEEHKAFARRFGTLHVHPLNHQRSGDEEIPGRH